MIVYDSIFDLDRIIQCYLGHHISDAFHQSQMQFHFLITMLHKMIVEGGLFLAISHVSIPEL